MEQSQTVARSHLPIPDSFLLTTAEAGTATSGSGKPELDLLSPFKASWGRELGLVATSKGTMGQTLT